MDANLEFRCPKCGKVLSGVTLDYFGKWLCSKCATNQTDVLHCERGCKVQAVDLDAGMENDSKQAHKLLTEGRIYEVESLNVGGWISSICLKEFQGKKFNTVHFKRYHEKTTNMQTVEILAGGKFDKAVSDLALTSAVLTYHYQPDPESCREDYQVWLLSKEDFDNLCAIDDDDWKKDWGWWRHCPGSNMTSFMREYIIHGSKIMAWDGYEREHFHEVCTECSNHYENCESERDPNSVCFATHDDKTQCFKPREYQDIISYFNDEIGASTEKNVCALAIDLANINDMTLSELFKKYLGGDINENN